MLSVSLFSTRRSPRCASICRARPRCSLRCARRTRPPLQLKPARRPARETARPRSARRGAARLTAAAGASAAHALCAPRHLHRRHLRLRRLRAPALPRWRAMRMSRAALAGAVRQKVLQRSMCETLEARTFGASSRGPRSLVQVPPLSHAQGHCQRCKCKSCGFCRAPSQPAAATRL